MYHIYIYIYIYHTFSFPIKSYRGMGLQSPEMLPKRFGNRRKHEVFAEPSPSELTTRRQNTPESVPPDEHQLREGPFRREGKGLLEANDNTRKGQGSRQTAPTK